MPAFLINEEEREALRGLPMLAREAYVFGLRPFMDYATGVVGIKRGVSWKSIAEELYVEPHQGIESGEPTEKQLRRAIVWLQKVGLVGENQADRRLVFPLLMATRDQSARNKVGSKRADHPGTQAGRAEPSIGAASMEEAGTQVEGVKSRKEGTPPVSGKSKALPPIPPAGGGAQATANFDPIAACPANVSPQTWADWCQHRVEIKKKLTPKTCEHQAKQLAGHPAPDAVINQSIANSWTGLFPEKVTHASSQNTGRQGSLSAVDQVRRAIAERQAQSEQHGQAVAEDGGALRDTLDGEFRRVG